MPLNIEDIFPNIKTGLGNIGFFFGAGTSKEAGFPLTDELTKKVINGLDSGEKIILEGLLKKEDISYSFDKGEPDIEVISDIISRHKLSETGNDIDDLEISIRKRIVEALVINDNLKLETHVKFLKTFRTLISNRPEPIWIFTTNYDLLLEMAAMEAKIPIYNSFEGVLNRYFDIERFNLKRGIVSKKTFQEYKEPYINLYKLHGSISWFKNSNDICEIGNYNSLPNKNRSMILPRKQKVLDTLEHPYDKLFRSATQVIGKQCKYLVSCGYSFRDQHINDQLIIPKLREGKIRFLALFKEEPENINLFKQYPSFNYLTQNKAFIDGNEITEDSDLWKFNKFVNLFAKKAGLDC